MGKSRHPRAADSAAVFAWLLRDEAAGLVGCRWCAQSHVGVTAQHRVALSVSARSDGLGSSAPSTASTMLTVLVVGAVATFVAFSRGGRPLTALVRAVGRAGTIGARVQRHAGAVRRLKDQLWQAIRERPRRLVRIGAIEAVAQRGMWRKGIRRCQTDSDGGPNAPLEKTCGIPGYPVRLSPAWSIFCPRARVVAPRPESPGV